MDCFAERNGVGFLLVVVVVKKQLQDTQRVADVRHGTSTSDVSASDVSTRDVSTTDGQE